MPKLAALLLAAAAFAAPAVALADPATLCAPFKSAWASKGRSAPGIPAVCVDYFAKSQPTHVASSTLSPPKTHATAPVQRPAQHVAAAPSPAQPEIAPPETAGPETSALEPDLSVPASPEPSGMMRRRGGRETPWAEGEAAMGAQNYEAAMTFFKEAAARGNHAAEVNVGVLYENGQGAPRDYAQAMSWYQRAAEQGNPRAERNIGALYARGLGVPQDRVKALSWFRRAADGGSRAAEYDIGLFYLNGWAGLPADAAQARSWFVRAANDGSPEARAWLAEHPY